MFRVQDTSKIVLLFLNFFVITFLVSGQKTLEFSISKINCNSNASDIAPIIRNNSIYFSSNRSENFMLFRTSTDSVNDLFSLFFAKVKNDSIFENVKTFKIGLGKISHSGPFWIDSSENEIYFNLNESNYKSFLRISKNKLKLKIHQAIKINNKWEIKEKLSFCNKDANYVHPFLNQKMDTIYFASNQDGGFGGYDLYYSVRKNGTWGEAVNLGSTINSKKNELFPTIAMNQLYFSSDREGGNGMLDIYGYNGNAAKNLGESLNSSFDDFNFYPLDKNKGYLVSNRDVRNDDIYFYKRLFPELKNCEPYKRDPLCFTFFEESGQIDDSLNLIYEWNFGDGYKSQGASAKHCYLDYGTFNVELNVVDRSTKYVFYNEVSYEFENLLSKRLHLNLGDKVQKDSLYELNASESSFEGDSIVKFYWDINNGEIRHSGDSKFNYNFATKDSVLIKLGAHILNKNGEERLECIEKIIRVVDKDDLINQNQTSDRVKPMNYENKLEINDSSTYALYLGKTDTLLDLKDEKFEGLGEIKMKTINDSVFLYLSREQKNIFELKNTQEHAVANGFYDTEVLELKNDEIVRKDYIENKEVISGIDFASQVIDSISIKKLHEIFYDFDKYSLKEKDKLVLKQLVEGLESSKDYFFYINSYTDSKGSDSYNLKLSQKRSGSVKNYLKTLGVKSTLIETASNGKRLPLNMQKLNEEQKRTSLIIVYEK